MDEAVFIRLKRLYKDRKAESRDFMPMSLPFLGKLFGSYRPYAVRPCVAWQDGRPRVQPFGQHNIGFLSEPV